MAPGGSFVKPDLTAPGVQILAGHTPTPQSVVNGPPGEFYQAIAGTSMSSPHVAGSALLVAALHPDWTPGQIKSALMTTATTDVVKQDLVTPADPFDMGAGRIDVDLAGFAPLTFDETAARYVALGNDPANAVHLNVPSINAPVMPGRLTTTRVATNVSGLRQRFTTSASTDGGTITVLPRTFTLDPGRSATITVTIEAGPDGEQHFGQVDIGASRGEGMHAPVAFVPTQSDITLLQACSPLTIPRQGLSTCKVTAQNDSPADTTVDLRTTVNENLRVHSTSGAAMLNDRTAALDNVRLAGTLPGVPSLAPGASPGGYVPLDAFAGTLVLPVGDEEIVNIVLGGPTFTFAGVQYGSIAITSNGYAVAGEGSAEDVQFKPPGVPDPARSNTVLAPFLDRPRRHRRAGHPRQRAERRGQHLADRGVAPARVRPAGQRPGVPAVGRSRRARGPVVRLRPGPPACRPWAPHGGRGREPRRQWRRVPDDAAHRRHRGHQHRSHAGRLRVLPGDGEGRADRHEAGDDSHGGRRRGRHHHRHHRHPVAEGPSGRSERAAVGGRRAAGRAQLRSPADGTTGAQVSLGVRRRHVLPADERWASLVRAVGMLVAVLGVGTVGYLMLGLGPLDALYQSVTTVTTVGFREVGEPTAAFRWFTIFLVLLGVGTVLYALGVLLEALVEGRITERFGRRRMERQMAELEDHVVVCGWGRVGEAIGSALGGSDGCTVVVVERDPARAATVGGLVVDGDATEDSVLRRAGVERCRALVVALPQDADNVYVTLSARRLRPDVFIVARAHVATAEAVLIQAGANRVVNPQAIGGARMAALIAQPHVADFLDVAMHDASLQFRLSELTVSPGSPVAGRSLRESHLRDATGALVLAVRSANGDFRTNPDPAEVMEAGEVLIAIGTELQLAALRKLVSGAR